MLPNRLLNSGQELRNRYPKSTKPLKYIELSQASDIVVVREDKTEETSPVTKKSQPTKAKAPGYMMLNSTGGIEIEEDKQEEFSSPIEQAQLFNDISDNVGLENKETHRDAFSNTDSAVLNHMLSFLSKSEIANVAATSKSLNKACKDVIFEPAHVREYKYVWDQTDNPNNPFSNPRSIKMPTVSAIEGITQKKQRLENIRFNFFTSIGHAHEDNRSHLETNFFYSTQALNLMICGYSSYAWFTFLPWETATKVLGFFCLGGFAGVGLASGCATSCISLPIACCLTGTTNLIRSRGQAELADRLNVIKEDNHEIIQFANADDLETFINTLAELRLKNGGPLVITENNDGELEQAPNSVARRI